MSVNLLSEIIADFHSRGVSMEITRRELSVPLSGKKIITIIGPRRSGKTFYLYSLINQLEKVVAREKIIYINFEDERLDLKEADFQNMLDAYQQLYPNHPLEDVYFFFDEIQNIPKWEIFVRRLEETISKKIFITGSSSKLLSKEIATSLRGRTLSFEMLSLSFKEYLDFQGLESKGIVSGKQKNLTRAAFDRFLQVGGYPEVVDEKDQEILTKTLQSYVDVMLYRDIIERHQVRNVHIIRDLLKRLLSNTAHVFSVHKYYRDLQSRNIKVSKDLLYTFLDHFTDAFLAIPLMKYDPSVVKREQALKKIYINDTGLAAANSYSLSEDKGRLFETLIFLELFKKGKEVYYFLNSGIECDFLIRDRGKVSSAVQACYQLTEENRKRETVGLLAAMEAFDLKEGFIVTHSQSETLEVKGYKINVVTAWQWILGLT